MCEIGMLLRRRNEMSGLYRRQTVATCGDESLCAGSSKVRPLQGQGSPNEALAAIFDLAHKK